MASSDSFLEPSDSGGSSVSPEVQRWMDDIAARLEKLERRLAGWEARAAALEDAEQTQAEPAAPLLGDVEARLERLEKRWFERRLKRLQAPAEAPVREPAPDIVPLDEGAAQALVYATWSALDVVPGALVEASVLSDGFPPEAEVVFKMGDIARPGTSLGRLVRPIGPDRGWVRVEWTAPALPAGRDVMMVSLMVTCGTHEAHAPILTVRRPA